MTKIVSTEGLSMLQAIDIWDDLLEAYYGVNGYGGNIAEIYGYRLSERNPTADLGEGFMGCREERDATATLRLKAMIRLFVERGSDANVTVDGIPWKRWKEPLFHRCHVKVVKKRRYSR